MAINSAKLWAQPEIQPLDPTWRNGFVTKIQNYAKEQAGDLPDISRARLHVQQAFNSYVDAYEGVMQPDQVRHSEWRCLRESAQGLVLAMNELSQYDNSVVGDAAKLQAELAPLLHTRAEKFRAERAAAAVVAASL